MHTVPHFNLSQVISAAGAFRKSGILAPLLVLCALISLPAMVVGVFTTGEYRFFCMLLTGIPVGVTLLAYVWFAIFNPNRLHSESYQLAAQSYGLLGDERITSPEMVRAIIDNVPAIMNPHQQEDVA